MRELFIRACILSALFLAAINALADDNARQDSQVQTEMSEKLVNPVTAGLLGGIVGFGAGHFHAYGEWTARSTMFVVTDIVTTPLLISSGILLAHGNPWGMMGMIIGVPVRISEGVYAASEAKRVTEIHEKYPSPGARFPDAAAVFSGIIGFGAGHIYAQKKVSLRSLIFTVADAVTLALLVNAIDSRTRNIDPYIWALEGVRGIELLDAALLANKANQTLPHVIDNVSRTRPKTILFL